MSRLLQEIEELSSQLEQVIDTSEHRFAIKESELVLAIIGPLVERISRQVSERELIARLPDDMAIEQISDAELEILQGVSLNLDLLKEQWLELDYKVRQSSKLDDSRQSLDNFINLLKYNNSVHWEGWCEELLSRFDVPEVALQTQVNVPGLDTLYRQYKSKYSQFKSLTNNLPTQFASIETISTITDDLSVLVTQMDFDLPSDVKKLFEALNKAFNNYQVPLSMLTPEVLKWLIEQGELDNFVVKRSQGAR
jgi:hypothetical protein